MTNRLRLANVLLVILIYGCSSTGSVDVSGGSGDSDNSEFDTDSICPIGALYDEAEDFCYIDCDGLDDDECYALEDEVFGDFDEYLVDDYGGKDAENFDDQTAIARYQIRNDLTLTTLENAEPENDGKFKEIWAGANKVLPRSKVLESFSQYHIDSDGADGNLAYVVGDFSLPGKWILAFDDADYIGPLDREFIHTTVHEFGHVVFLGVGQLDATSTGDCPTYGIEEGCSYKESYINKFYQQFWSDIIEEHSAMESEEGISAFYDKYQERFVSEYSATNPVEDAAEVFTHFVLRDKPDNSDSVINQKIRMMYDEQALVMLRNDIRGKLTITRARNRKSKK